MDELIVAWCRIHLAIVPRETLFEVGHLSRVIGLRLDDGRKVVVKVRPWQHRLLACGRVQRGLAELGFPAPELLVGPERDDGYAISAETMVDGGRQLGNHPRAALLFSAGLRRFIDLASRLDPAGSLEPSPPWVGWDHPGPQLWPPPDDRVGDLNKLNPGDWLDEIAIGVRERLASFKSQPVTGHGDWYSQNIRWVDDTLHAVHDWDSVVSQPEAAIAGHAAAVWPGTGGPGEVASIEQSEEFLDGYADARGRPWSREELEAAWAAGLWNRAFDAKKALLVADDADLILTRSEGAERARRAGLPASSRRRYRPTS